MRAFHLFWDWKEYFLHLYRVLAPLGSSGSLDSIYGPSGSGNRGPPWYRDLVESRITFGFRKGTVFAIFTPKISLALAISDGAMGETGPLIYFDLVDGFGPTKNISFAISFGPTRFLSQDKFGFIAIIHPTISFCLVTRLCSMVLLPVIHSVS